MARSRQADFERIRRRYLPLGRSSSGGRCDERIGRFCLTHDGGVDWPIRRERPEVGSARTELIAHLASARDRLPGDAWINGQLIRYLSEDRRHEEAIAAAEECRAAPGWCSSLVGFAYHYSGKPGEAAAAFESALRLLDDAERKSWADLSPLLSGQPASAYKALSPADRTAFEDRFWTLADPLYTRAGNELRSEHYARHVWTRLQERAESPEGGSWSADQKEVLLRYGWPLGWERLEATPGQPLSARVIAHLGGSPFLLLPPADALLGRIPATDWDVWNRAPRAEYEVPLQDSIATWIYPLDHQFALFQREAGPLLVAAYALPGDSAPLDVKVQSALGIQRLDPRLASASTVPRESVGRRGAQVMTVPAGVAVVASLELVLPETRHLSRARRLLALPAAPAGPQLSDLLLIDAALPLPDSLEDAVSRARGSTAVFAGEEVGIFWELYTDDEGGRQTIDLTLRFAPEGSGGILRRVAERVGLARSAVPVRLEWEEPLPEGRRLSRSMTVQVPPSADGDYTLELTVEWPDEPPIIARQAIHVIRR